MEWAGTTHFLLVVRIGEASNPGPSTTPVMSIRPDSHWIAGGSEDERSSDWSVEDMYELNQRAQECVWHDISEEANAACPHSGPTVGGRGVT